MTTAPGHPRDDELRGEQEKIAPGPGFGAGLDRLAWSAAGQRIAGKWTWKGTLSPIATFAVVAVVLVFGIGVQPAGPVAGFVVFLLAIWRGRRLHERYLGRPRD